MALDDFRDFRSPLRSNGSIYSLETGICVLDSDRLESGAIINPAAEAEFLHETAHWLTEALTSVGQFLVFLKTERERILQQAIFGSGAIRDVVRYALAHEAGRVPILDWTNGETYPRVTGLPEDAVFRTWLGGFWAEGYLGQGQIAGFDPLSMAGVIGESISFYDKALNEGGLLSHHVFSEADVDHFIANTMILLMHQGNGPFETGITTQDLIEAVAVIAELLWAERSGILQAYCDFRMEEIARSSYFEPIRRLCYHLGLLATPSAVVGHAAGLLAILDACLNPPIPPIEAPDKAFFAFQHVYPPSRFSRVITKAALLREQFFRCPSADFDNRTDKFREAVYATMDPPNRNFHVRVTENKRFNVFGDLPHRAPLENMFAWIVEDWHVQPVDVRIWAASQLRLDLYGRKMDSLTHAILHPDLRFTRFCKPLLTFRAKDRRLSSLPVNSQLLDADEPLEWFLVNSGIQYAGADILLGSGRIEFQPFAAFPDLAEMAWFGELENRTRIVLGSIIGR